MSKIKELNKDLKVPSAKDVMTTVVIEHNDFFQIVERGEKYIIVSGNMQATRNEFSTLEEAKEYIDSKPYDLIFSIAYILYTNITNKENNNNN